MKPKTSYIWTYFSEVDGENVRCSVCNKVYSRKGRGTTSLKNHLRSAHSNEYSEFIKHDKEEKDHNLKVKDKHHVTPLQEAKKQMTLEEALNKNMYWDTSHPKSKEMDKLITEMIAVQNLPFNFVESVGFRRVIHAAVPRYRLRGRQFFTSNMYNEVYPKLATKIRGLLKTFHSLSFTTDIWSEPSAGVSLLSLTCHGINSDFRKVSIMLKCEIFEGRHTGDIIAEKLKSMLAHWQIPPEKVHCIIRDNGSNIKRAVNLLHLNDIDCTVHQIQLCVRAALESEKHISQLITKCKDVATHFNHSIIAQEELKHIRERLNQSSLSVLQDCSTRWNSTFYMMQRLIQIKDAVSLYACKRSIPQISPEDWLDIEKCVRLLQPFEEMTKVMSSSQASISSVIPLIHALKTALQEEEKKDDGNQVFKNIIQKLTEELNGRFGELQNNKVFAIATYLDPRYKLKFFNEIFKDKVQSDMLILFDGDGESKSKNTTYGPPPEKKQKVSTSQPSTSSQKNPIANVLSINTFLANILTPNSDEDTGDDIDEEINQTMIMKSLLLEYNKHKRLNIDEDPLLWWKENKKYQMFFNVVRQYLSPPPSSVPSEQLFSSAGLIYDELRNRLDGDKATVLLFIKHNLPLLNFDY